MLPFKHKVQKMIRLTVTIITALGMPLCQGFTLELTPSFVGTHVTERVVLTCLYGGRTSINGSIKSIRILKESESGRWELIAEIVANKTTVNTSDSNVLASGLIGNLNDSFLTVSWPVASEDIPDRYRCEVVAVTSDGDFVKEKTEDIFVSERNFMLQSVLKIIKEEKENNKRELEAMKDMIRKTSVAFEEEKENNKRELAAMRDMIQKNSMAFEEEKENNKQEFAAIKKIINDTDCDKITKCSVGSEDRSSTNLPKSIDQSSEKVNSLTTETALTTKPEEIQFWPGGSFGLLSTSSGCPSSQGESWYTGYRRHHTESSDANHNEVSLVNHLMKPLYEDSNNQKFMYQHFCLLNSTKLNVLWPNGSYCINKYIHPCPLGFKGGFIFWDDENTKASSSSSGPLHMGPESFTMIDYCCRSHDLAISPIHLPNNKPFYLYRYGGTCQGVVGMRVSEEFMLFDTENTNNQDMFDSPFHPDGKANNDVQLNLCYYEPV